MNIANTKIGTRLGMGFGVVVLLMITLIVYGLICLTKIDDLNDKIINKDWAKSTSLHKVDSLIQDDARLTLELFIVNDPNQSGDILRAIDSNRSSIDSVIEFLEKTAILPEGKAMLSKLKQKRERYVESFKNVSELLTAKKHDEAAALMNSETIPALNQLQGDIETLVKLQQKIVDSSGGEIQRNIESARDLMIGLGLTAALISIVVAYWVGRSITVPLTAAVKIAQTVAGGDLTSHIEVTRQDETGQLLQALKDMNLSLVNMVVKVRSGTDTIATASSQISAGNQDLSSRTEEQASSLEETAASMEELTSAVKQNADNARQANTLAASASTVAMKGGAAVSQVVETMGAINDSAKRIVDIIGVIDGIAFQTNILALNAAVEAARAGEQGRGFAVVATEVRNLAQRSAAAAKEIKTLIGDSVEKVGAGSKLVDQAGATMNEVVVSIRRVTEIMGEITSASQEQSTGIEQVNQAISQMDQVTQQNAALVEEAAAAAESLHQQAGDLVQMVSTFKTAGDMAAPARKSSHAATVVRKTSLAKNLAKAPTTLSVVANSMVPSSINDWEQF